MLGNCEHCQGAGRVLRYVGSDVWPKGIELECRPCNGTGAEICFCGKPATTEDRVWGRRCDEHPVPAPLPAPRVRYKRMLMERAQRLGLDAIEQCGETYPATVMVITTDASGLSGGTEEVA